MHSTRNSAPLRSAPFLASDLWRCAQERLNDRANPQADAVGHRPHLGRRRGTTTEADRSCARSAPPSRTTEGPPRRISHSVRHRRRVPHCRSHHRSALQRPWPALANLLDFRVRGRRICLGQDHHRTPGWQALRPVDHHPLCPGNVHHIASCRLDPCTRVSLLHLRKPGIQRVLQRSTTSRVHRTSESRAERVFLCPVTRDVR